MNQDKLKHVMLEDINGENNFQQIQKKIRPKSFRLLKGVSMLLVASSILLFLFRSTTTLSPVEFSLIYDSTGFWDSQDIVIENNDDADYNSSYNFKIKPKEEIDTHPQTMIKQAKSVVRARLQKEEVIVDEKGIISTRYSVKVLDVLKGNLEKTSDIVVLGGVLLTEQYQKLAPQIANKYDLNMIRYPTVSTYLSRELIFDSQMEYLLCLNQDQTLVQKVGIYRIEDQKLIDCFGNQYDWNK